jgi:serine/threonine protein kinase
VLWGKEGHSFEVDVWALGVIVYTMLVGRPPFETRDLQETYIKIKNASFVFPKHVRVSELAKKFISDLLKIDPEKRLPLEKILTHEFFKGRFI